MERTRGGIPSLCPNDGVVDALIDKTVIDSGVGIGNFYLAPAWSALNYRYFGKQLHLYFSGESSGHNDDSDSHRGRLPGDFSLKRT